MYQQGSGGGVSAILHGETFEKAAVHFSHIQGKEFPGDSYSGAFEATGVSLITHMQNPYAPTVHMNIRCIQAGDKAWFGGGYDLTPMGFPFDEDTKHFHNTAEKTLTPFGETLYPSFYQNAKEYFYIPHRNKERGVGGIFFDHYWTGDLDRDLAMWEAVGETFLEAILPIYRRRVEVPYTQKDKEKQNYYRAHYAEFNLLYDRGTKFGLQSGGNPETILSSLPPVATWKQF
jgi:coproporphyrinogen III oxidase